ncbi:hypothetical protein ACFL54_08910, partial [Planctomycetota bacterium]
MTDKDKGNGQFQDLSAFLNRVRPVAMKMCYEDVKRKLEPEKKGFVGISHSARKPRPVAYFYITVAACIGLVFGIYWFSRGGDKTGQGKKNVTAA